MLTVQKMYSTLSTLFAKDRSLYDVNIDMRLWPNGFLFDYEQQGDGRLSQHFLPPPALASSHLSVDFHISPHRISPANVFRDGGPR